MTPVRVAASHALPDHSGCVVAHRIHIAATTFAVVYRMKSISLVLILATLVAARAQSPETSPPPVSLETLVAEIAAANPERRFYEAEIAAAQAARRSAGAWNEPELSVEAGRKRVRDASGDLIGEGMAWSVSLAQTFEWPGRLALRKSIANREIELAELGLAQFEAALASRARLLAHALAAAQEKATATAEVARRYEALRELFVSRDPAGLTPLLETRVIEAQELALKRRATSAALEAQAALAELNQLRGAPYAQTISLKTPSWTFGTMPSIEALLAAARENHFAFRIRQLELARHGDEVSLARSSGKPSVTVSPFYSQERAGDREVVAGVGVSLPLPVTGRARGAADLAAARQRQAEAALALAGRELEREVVVAASAFEVTSAANAQWSDEAVEKFREAAALADRHFRLGAVPLATYVELQTSYLDAVEALLDTRRDVLDAAQRLRLLTGVSLTTEAAR